jgi:hypothetical protein
LARSELSRRRARWRRAARVITGLGAVAGLLGVAFACTELAPGSDTLPEQVISANRPDAGPVDPAWACLDEPPPGSAAASAASVVLTLTVTDIVTQRPPDGLLARACAKVDVLCGAPTTANVPVAEDGSLHLDVPQAFDGFVELTSPATVSTMYFLNRPLMTDASESFTIVSRAALAGLAMQGNVPLDPNLGHLLVRTFDCLGAPASEVSLVSDVDGTAFAFVDGLPNPGLSVTTADGLVGFVNVPIGYAVLQARRRERSIGTASLFVRPGWFTYGDMEPLPQ